MWEYHEKMRLDIYKDLYITAISIAEWGICAYSKFMEFTFM